MKRLFFVLGLCALCGISSAGATAAVFWVTVRTPGLFFPATAVTESDPKDPAGVWIEISVPRGTVLTPTTNGLHLRDPGDIHLEFQQRPDQLLAQRASP